MDSTEITHALRDLPIVVTGGAGYVGSAVAHLLTRLGAKVTVVDTLVRGHLWAVGSLPIETVDIRDRAGLVEVFRARGTRAVCHLAALATIPESFADPDGYMDVNHRGTTELLAAMREAKVPVLAFASTCAIYATPADSTAALREGGVENPLSPYATGKQLAERAIREADARGEVHASAFRFFNAAGADRVAGVGEVHEPETHAIPRLVRWAMGQGSFAVFGTDYPTRDGTCVRDYVHNEDLAWAHARALAALTTGNDRARSVFNLGSGVGTSVRELVERTCGLMGVTARPTEGPRRDGDAPTLLADSAHAREVLGWIPQHDLDGIL
ncbi:MAG: UDP-glucose 4-epimerase GalE, partial [Deltaproteobacteria bacterium]